MASAHQEALRAAIAAIDPPACAADPLCVNLLGISIYQKHWQGSLSGLRRVLEAMGLRVGAMLGAGCSVAEIRALRAARHNVVLHQEYADAISPWIEARYGVPTMVPGAGAPIGFEATEQWLREVAAAVGCDPSPALRHIEDARRVAFPPSQPLPSPDGPSEGGDLRLARRGVNDVTAAKVAARLSGNGSAGGAGQR